MRLLGRPDCHLCEDFLAALRADFPQLAVVESNVDDDPLLRRRHGLEIPVLLADDGSVVCRTFYRREDVAEALRERDVRSPGR